MTVNSAALANYNAMTRYLTSIAVQECAHARRDAPPRKRLIERRFRIERRLKRDPSLSSDLRGKDRRRATPYFLLVE